MVSVRKKVTGCLSCSSTSRVFSPFWLTRMILSLVYIFISNGPCKKVCHFWHRSFVLLVLYCISERNNILVLVGSLQRKTVYTPRSAVILSKVFKDLRTLNTVFFYHYSSPYAISNEMTIKKMVVFDVCKPLKN